MPETTGSEARARMARTLATDDLISTRTAWIVVTIVLLGGAAMRLHLLDVPLERDEGEYAYVAQLLLHGVAPFKGAYTMKLPGTAAAYAAAMALLGDTPAAVRIALLVVNAATTLLIFTLGKRVFGVASGLVAAASFACLSLTTGMLGIFAHATHFVVLPAVGGILLVLLAIESRRLATFFASGALLGLAIVMKQPGIVFAVFALVWLGCHRARARRRAETRRAVSEGAALLTGIAVPLVATAAALAAAGVLSTSWFWCVEYARAYERLVTWSQASKLFAMAFWPIVAQAPLFWALAAFGLVALAMPGFQLPQRAFVLALLAFSVVGVCLGLYFRNHYFILALPAVSLLVAAAFEAMLRLGRRTPAAMIAASAVIALAGGIAMFTQADILFRMSPEQVSRAIYAPNPFPEVVEVARYMRAHTRSDERIAVLGSEPEIYFYAARRSASPHIYMYGLMEKHPFAAAMQEEFIRDVTAARPSYVVWVNVRESWLASPDSPRRLFEWARPYMTENYDVVGHVVAVADHTAAVWGDAASRLPFGEATRLLVLRRKDR